MRPFSAHEISRLRGTTPSTLSNDVKQSFLGRGLQIFLDELAMPA